MASPERISRIVSGPLDQHARAVEPRLAIASDATKGVVYLNFSRPTTWVGFPLQLARELRESLDKHIATLEAHPPEKAPGSRTG